MALSLGLSAIGAWIGAQTAGVWGVSSLIAARWGAAVGGALGSYIQRPQGVTAAPDSMAGITFTTATKGHPLQVLWGKNRMPGTVIWYGNFQRQEEEVEVSSGGKGFGGTETTTTIIRYTCSVAIALCEGVIQPTIRMWANEEEVDLATIAYTVHTGLLGQASDAHMDANLDAGQVSLNYPGIAYIMLENYPLGVTTTFPSMTFEVQRGLAEVMLANRFFPPELSGVGEDVYGDMNPACIIADLLTNPRYGLGLSETRLNIESFVDAAQWCLDNQLYVSPIVAAGTSGLEHIEHLLSYMDGFMTHSQGKVKLLIRTDATEVVSVGRPVDFSATPAAGYEDFNILQHAANVVPSEIWRNGRRLHLTGDIGPDAVTREDRAGVDHYWYHDRERGVLMDWNTGTGAVIFRRLLPIAVGAIVAASSSNFPGTVAADAFDANPATAWRPLTTNVQAWVSGTFGVTDTDSVQVDWNRLAAGAPGLAQPYRRGLRLDPSDHNDPTQTTNAICTAIVNTMVAHDINQVSVFVSLSQGFYFNTGTVDYIPYGSDGGDFLATFIPLANASGIAVYASLFYLFNTEFTQANAAYLELEDGTPYNEYWMCPNKPGVLAWWNGILNTLLTAPAYAALTGVDLAEPQWGFVYGNQTCWCDPCQAAFALAHPVAEFGESDISDLDTTDTPAITTWEQWRGDVLAAAINANNVSIGAAGFNSALVTVLGTRTTRGTLLSFDWKLKLEGLDLDGLLDGAAPPDIIINQATWQEKAAQSKDYITFSPEWTEYATRQWGAWIYGRAVSVIHIGAYHTDDIPGSNWNYGYDHDLTAVELQRAYEAAMRGGALSIESYSYASIVNEGLWAGIDEAYGVGAAVGPVYNSVLCEIQRWDGVAWLPIGLRAWFRTRASAIAGMPPVEDPFLGHFDRLNTDRFRILLYPSPDSSEVIEITDTEIRSHSIQEAGVTEWGGMDFDNHAAGTADLWLVRWLPAQAFMHRIDEATGLDVGASPWAFDTFDIENVNDLAILQVGAEPRLIVQSQGFPGQPARLTRYSTAAPGTLVGPVEFPAFDGTTGYIGITHDAAAGYLVFTVAQANRGINIWWADPTTLLPTGSYAALEYNWFWPSSLCWANTDEGDLLACDDLSLYYVYRRNSRLTDGGTPSVLGESVRWDAATVDCDVQLEEALAIPTTSVNTITELKAVVWDRVDLGVGAPIIDVYGGTAEEPGIWTHLGTMEYAGLGDLRLAELTLASPYPDVQRVRFRFTRGVGSVGIAVAEIMATRTLVADSESLSPTDYVEGGAPVLSRQGTRDTANSVRVEYRARIAADYNVSIAERRDDASVTATGERAVQFSLHGITRPDVADKLTAKLLRHMSIPSVGISLTLGPQHGLLEPGDIIEITDADYGIDSLRLRILRMSETKDGHYEIQGTQEF